MSVTAAIVSEDGDVEMVITDLPDQETAHDIGERYIESLEATLDENGIQFGSFTVQIVNHASFGRSVPQVPDVYSNKGKGAAPKSR